MRNITNPAHAFVQRAINEVMKIYNNSFKILQDKKYSKNSIEYKIYKHLLNTSQDVLRELKIIRCSVISVYNSDFFNCSPAHLYKEVVKDVTEILKQSNNICLNLSDEILVKSLI